MKTISKPHINRIDRDLILVLIASLVVAVMFVSAAVMIFG